MTKLIEVTKNNPLKCCVDGKVIAENEGVVYSPNCGKHMHITHWVETGICPCCKKPGVPRLGIYIGGRIVREKNIK